MVATKDKPARVDLGTRTFPGEATAAAEARTWLADVVEVGRRRGAEIALVASELVSEALDAGASGPVDVAVAWVPDGLEVSVAAAAEPVRRGFTVQWRRAILERLARDWSVDVDDADLCAWAVIPVGSAAESVSDAALLQRAVVDPDARDEVFRRFSPLARQIAARYRGSGIDGEDLDQVASLALMTALDRFDPDAGDFEHYAAATISGELKRHLRDRAWAVRVPRSLQEAVLEVSRASRDLSQRLGREPGAPEIAAETGMSEEEVREAQAAGGAYRSTSLSAIAPGSDSETTLLDRIGMEDGSLGLVDEWSTVAGLIGRLPEREQRILSLRFAHDLTQSEIAAIIGVSQMHVSRLLAGALARLRALAGEAPE